MASFSGSLDIHREEHVAKNVADNAHSAHVEAAKNNIVMCIAHPGFWVSKPGFLRAIVRDCPACLESHRSLMQSPAAAAAAAATTSDATSVTTSAASANAATTTNVSASGLTQKKNDNTDNSNVSDKSVPFSATKTINYPGGGVYIGTTYSGDSNIRHGHGKMTSANGNVYDGQWENGKEHGEGTAIYVENGSTYKGSFVKGIKHGKGVYEWPNGNVYDGEYVDGKREGHGVLKKTNGENYCGQFKNNLYDGVGVLTDANGKVCEGIFANGKFQES